MTYQNDQGIPISGYVVSLMTLGEGKRTWIFRSRPKHGKMNGLLLLNGNQRNSSETILESDGKIKCLEEVDRLLIEMLSKVFITKDIYKVGD